MGRGRKLGAEVIDLSPRNLGAEHPTVLHAKHNQAVALYHLGKLDDTRKLGEEALAQRRRSIR